MPTRLDLSKLSLMDALDLAGTGGARGHGRRALQRDAQVTRTVHHGILADAGGAGEDDDQRRGDGDVLHEG